MRLNIIFILLAFNLINNSFSQSYCYTDSISDVLKNGNCNSYIFNITYSNECDSSINYAPVIKEHVPIKRIRLVIHVFQKSDISNPQNFQNNTTDKNILKDIINRVNTTYSDLAIMNPNPNNSPYIYDSRVRFLVDTIFFYRDDIAWESGYLSGSTDGWSYLYPTYVINNVNLTEIQKENSLHIFVTGVNEDEDPEHYGAIGGYASGIPSKCFVSVKSWYYWCSVSSGSELIGHLYEMSNNLQHELGHSLGLYHIYQSTDYCNDTPNYSTSGNTNNVLDG